jgi:excisionase family DNA binding protein
MSQARKWTEPRALPASPVPRAADREPAVEDEILTAREAQRLLKIGRTKLWDLTRRSEIPAYRVGSGDRSSLRYKRQELLSWLEGNRIQGSAV